MRHAKRFVVLLFALLMLSSLYVASVSAQNRRFVRRAVIVRPYVYRDPFWYSRNWWWHNDPYWSDPFLRVQRERYYKEKAVRDARKEIAEDNEEFREDGYISPKERKEMAKNRERYAKALRKLDEYNRDN